MSSDETKSVPFHFMLSPALKDRLFCLSKAREIPVSGMFRTAILAYLDHQEQKQPTCADGTPCLCPNRWSRTARIERMEKRAEPDKYMEGSES